MVEERKRSLKVYLVGFLKPAYSGTREVESWLDRFWGKTVVGVKSMEVDTRLIELASDKEVAKVPACAKDFSSSPFLVLEIWMEVIGSPTHPQWVKFSGVPLQTKRVGIFRLLGDCLGQTLEIDRRTCSKEVI